MLGANWTMNQTENVENIQNYIFQEKLVLNLVIEEIYYKKMSSVNTFKLQLIMVAILFK